TRIFKTDDHKVRFHGTTNRPLLSRCGSHGAEAIQGKVQKKTSRSESDASCEVRTVDRPRCARRLSLRPGADDRQRKSKRKGNTAPPRNDGNTKSASFV